MSVQIILKNSSVEDKRPTANQLANGEVSLNYDEAGAFLCCRDTNGDIQQVGGIKISEDAPGTPVKGTLWLQPSTSTLYVHNGTSWLSIAGGGGGGGGVAGVSQIIGNDGIDVAPASGTGIVSVNADIDTDRGLEFVAGQIAVNLGTGLSFNSNTGAIEADNQALSYKGTVNLTADAAVPANPAVGDTYANVGPANTAMNAVWLAGTGLAAQTTNPGDLVAWNGTTWTYIPTGSPGGGNGGVTNLDYTPTTGGSASQGGIVESSTGTNADIPMVGNVTAGVLGGAAQAGLMYPDDKTLIDQLPTDANGNLDIGTVTGITPGAGLRNDATAGLNATEITTSGTISIGLTAASGLELDPAGTSGGLQVDLQAAGAGTGGLELSGNEIRVDADTNRGVSLTAAGVGVNITANQGLQFNNGTGALEVNPDQIGAPDGDSAFGYWDRDNASTTLSPRTAGDNITTTGDLSAADGTFSGLVTSEDGYTAYNRAAAGFVDGAAYLSASATNGLTINAGGGSATVPSTMRQAEISWAGRGWFNGGVAVGDQGIGGSPGTNPNITLNANGNATFNGVVSINTHNYGSRIYEGSGGFANSLVIDGAPLKAGSGSISFVTSSDERVRITGTGLVQYFTDGTEAVRFGVGQIIARKLSLYPPGGDSTTDPGVELSHADGEDYLTAVANASSGVFAIKSNASGAARLYFKSVGNIDENVQIYRQNQNLILDAANGSVTPLSLTLRTDPDNPANFNAEGEYTGPTLDVKDRILNLISRLDALEANEVIDDATDASLLQLVASATTRLDNIEARLTALEGGN